MARSFNSANPDYVVFSGTPAVTTEPLSISCLFKPTAAAMGQRMGLCVLRIQGSTHWWHVGKTTGDQIEAHQRGSTFSGANSGGAISQDTWHHAGGVFAADNDRRAFLDGGNKGTDATDIATNAPDRIYVGARQDNQQQFDGVIAEVGIWDVALTDEEMAVLGLFVSPLFVRPQNLVFYAPFLSRASPEPDLVGRQDLTLTGTTVADHPRIIYPGASPFLWAIPSAAPSGDLDTENKRRSGGALWWDTIRPLPDAEVAQADRQSVAWIYAGILAQQVGPTGPRPGSLALMAVGR